ncbi:hypothetical protein ZIOFF_033369 [Zingiber officinale]|uniref:Uncharacterized protein n=1 Tax=Zingiber officinale TaxID=94328 RepID=A0A8J5H0T4_ZINOF|nr:hypothetical protein ZIOFF_033369 [Zingiber officinale]
MWNAFKMAWGGPAMNVFKMLNVFKMAWGGPALEHAFKMAWGGPAMNVFKMLNVFKMAWGGPGLAHPMSAAVKVMAKDLIRTRHQITKFYALKSQLQGVSLRIQVT